MSQYVQLLVLTSMTKHGTRYQDDTIIYQHIIFIMK